MTKSNPLAEHLVSPRADAGFEARRGGNLARIEPLTAAAEAWLRANADSDASWVGDTLVVEMRYFAGLADAIIASGFTFERDPHPN